MKVIGAELVQFRNIVKLELKPGPGLNLFYGANGQGKTNLLEALFAVLRGQSFRPYAAKNDWLPQSAPQGVAQTRVAARLEDPYGFPLETEFFRKNLSNTGKWEIFFNGKRSNPYQIRERIPAVAFSPDDHALIRLGPELRRNYLDELFTDVCPGYSEVLQRFEKTLKSRNRLLRARREQNHSAHDEHWKTEMKTWTEMLAQTSAELSDLRHDIWQEFAGRFERTGRELFHELSTDLRLEFQPDLRFLESQRKDANALYFRHIQASLETDLATGWTHRGPHRDDFLIFIDGVESRMGSSQGQARLLALLLRWLHADWIKEERRQPPIFFIDDLSSELDSARRARLLELVKSLNGQIFVTSTDASLIDSGRFYEYTCYFVKKGTFRPAQGGAVPADFELENS